MSNKDGRIYDRFRNRVMFPIIDIRGDVIGFGGRVMDDSTPKYLNSPDTPVYNKSRNVFALNIAKKSRAGRVILTEGYMDTISLHQAGFDNAIATLGTSLTEEQARLISQYTDQVIVAYDSDGPGQAATKRAINIFDQVGVKVNVLTVTGAKDPDEFIKSSGAEAFRALIEDSENGMEYRLQSAAAGFDMGTDDGKVGYLKEAAGIIAALLDPVSREVYSMRVAEQCSVAVEAVRDAVNQDRRRKINTAQRRRERDDTRPDAAGAARGAGHPV